MSTLVCPNCARNDGLSTTERLSGHAPIVHVTAAADGTRHFDWVGRTEVDYDSATTVGVNCCYCGWSYDGDDWLNQLAVEPERCALCGEAVEQRSSALVHRDSGLAACHDPADIAAYADQLATAPARS
ncbi:MAG TPA: hypothetical protein VFQ85_07410 [Mycobacteriales bacterium]|nr:hypothetical protein [Mycobacteriales bacterium]